MDGRVADDDKAHTLSKKPLLLDDGDGCGDSIVIEVNDDMDRVGRLRVDNRKNGLFRCCAPTHGLSIDVAILRNKYTKYREKERR